MLQIARPYKKQSMEWQEISVGNCQLDLAHPRFQNSATRLVAKRLKVLAENLTTLYTVMQFRAYFENPRTTVGWNKA